MRNFIKFKLLSLAAITVLTFCGLATAQTSARRDYLSPEEIDRVKEAQLIDLRTAVFIKAAERRIAALTDPNAAASKQAQKDVEKWGAFPTGTRAELINDFVGILDAAIDNIENASEHKGDAGKFAKAVKDLATACRRWQPQLATLRERSTELGERNNLERALEFAESVIEAEKKLPDGK